MRIPGASTDEERQQLGNKLKAMIESGLMDKGSLPQRWSVNQANYDNNPARWSNRFLPGAEMMHFPLVQPKVDRLAGATVRTMMGADPVLTGTLRGQGQRVEDVENTLQFFMDIGQLELRLRQLGTMSGVSDCAVLRVAFDVATNEVMAAHPEHVVTMPGMLHYAGFKFDVIHPDDFVVFPSTPFGIQAATMCGHRFWRTMGEIDELKITGRYFDDAQVAIGPDPTSYGTRDWQFSRLASNSAPDTDDMPVELWEVIVKLRLGKAKMPSRYRCTVAISTGALLAIAPYNYIRPNYREFRFKDIEHGSYWPGRSVSQDLQGLQRAYNHLHNLMIYGSYHSAFPAIFGEGLPHKVVQYMAGDMVRTDGGDLMQANVRFQAQHIPEMIDRIEVLGDKVVRISSMGTGGQLKGDTSATEVAAIVRGQEQGENDYLLNFGASLYDIADMMREQLFANWNFWKPLYGEQAPVRMQEDLMLPVRWTLQGRNPMSTPEVMMAKFEKLIEKAQMFPDAGINVFEVLQSYVNAMQLANAEKILPDQAVMTQGPAAGLTQGGLNELVPQLLAASGGAGAPGAPGQLSAGAY